MSRSVVGYFVLIALRCAVEAHEAPEEVKIYDPVQVTVHPKPICLPGRLPRDCGEVYKAGIRNNGVYIIQPLGCLIPFKVYCEITRTEGWTVIMSRFDGSVDFNRSWADYKKGFGDVYGEYWLGNDHIHRLTNQKHSYYILKVEFRFWHNINSYSVDYDGFRVESEQHQYKLRLRSFKPCTSVFNGLGYHNGRPFSTFDRDNDSSSKGDCAKYHGGGFWYGACHHAKPIGLYQMARTVHQVHQCMEWEHKALRVMTFKIAPYMIF